MTPDLVNWSRSFRSLFTVRLLVTPKERGVPAGRDPPRLGRRFCLRLETAAKILLLLCWLF